MRHSGEVSIDVVKGWGGMRHDVYITARDQGKLFVASLAWAEHAPEGATNSLPALELGNWRDDPCLERLMVNLFDLGIRPDAIMLGPGERAAHEKTIALLREEVAYLRKAHAYALEHAVRASADETRVFD